MVRTKKYTYPKKKTSKLSRYSYRIRNYPELYPKPWDSVVLYFKNLFSIFFVNKAFMSTSAPVDYHLVDTNNVTLGKFFTSFRVEKITATITLPEASGNFEVITCTWDQDTPQNTIGAIFINNTQTYNDLQSLQNVRSHTWTNQVIKTTWRMNPSLDAHTTFRPVPAVTSTYSQTSFQRGGVAIGVVGDSIQNNPAARIQTTYKVRYTGRKNI